SATPPASAGNISPALEAELDGRAAAYKQIGQENLDQLAAAIGRMVAAIQANDLDTARAAWLDARTYYERSEAFTFKFPCPVTSSEPGPAPPRGFHAVEGAISGAGGPPPLAAAQELADKVDTLRTVYASQPLYAHGLLIGMGGLAYQ